MFSCLMCKLHIISWVYSELWYMTCKSDSSCMNPHTHMSQVIAKPRYYWVLWFFLSWLLSWFKRNKTNPSTIHPSQLHFHGFATIFKFAAKKQQITYSTISKLVCRILLDALSSLSLEFCLFSTKLGTSSKLPEPSKMATINYEPMAVPRRHQLCCFRQRRPQKIRRMSQHYTYSPFLVDFPFRKQTITLSTYPVKMFHLYQHSIDLPLFSRSYIPFIYFPVN